MSSVPIASLKHGDPVTLFINGNFTSGRVVIAGRIKYVANNDYFTSLNAEPRKRSERFGYRLLYDLSSGNVSKITKVSIEDLPYKTRDVLVDNDGDKVKVLGRSGGVHHLSQHNDFDEYGQCATRKELDASGYTLDNDDEDEENDEPSEMTVDEICAELGRTVKIVKKSLR